MSQIGEDGVCHRGRRVCRRAFVSLAALLSLASVARPAHALRVKSKLGLSELIEESALILIAQAIDVDTRAGNELGPITRVSFSVQDLIAGADPGSEFFLELPGGTLPDSRFVVLAGAPCFSKGETYLLFIRNGDWRLTPITNAHYGVYRQVRIGETYYLVTTQGRGIQRLDDSGFQPGPVLTDLIDTPTGMLKKSRDGKLEEEIVRLRAPGCVTRVEITDMLKATMGEEGFDAMRRRVAKLRVNAPVLVSQARAAK